MSSLFGALLWLFTSLGLGPVYRPQSTCACAQRTTADSYDGGAVPEVCAEEAQSRDWSGLSWLSSTDPGEPISNGF